jgi:hypothetical protein
LLSASFFAAPLRNFTIVQEAMAPLGNILKCFIIFLQVFTSLTNSVTTAQPVASPLLGSQP